jgi:hypothetical protein
VLGTIDTPEKFAAKRAVLAQHEWDRMKANDSQECRNCHNYTYMDYAEQNKPLGDQMHQVAFNQKADLHRLPQGHRPHAAAGRAAHRRAARRCCPRGDASADEEGVSFGAAARPNLRERLAPLPKGAARGSAVCQRNSPTVPVPIPQRLCFNPSPCSKSIVSPA